MFRIALYNRNCCPICDGLAYFFTESIAEFVKYWRPHAHKEQWERFERSKGGEIVTDYYSNDPEWNIVQEDIDAEILFEKELILEDKLFTLYNAYQWPSEVYAAKTTIQYRGIRFLGKCHLIGKYKMEGVCKKPLLAFDQEEYQTVSVWGNPVFICNLEEKSRWIETDNGRERITYRKEDFAEDTIETYCYVIAGYFAEEDIINGTVDLESDETLECLLRDIPGEAG